MEGFKDIMCVFFLKERSEDDRLQEFKCFLSVLFKTRELKDKVELVLCSIGRGDIQAWGGERKLFCHYVVRIVSGWDCAVKCVDP